MSGMEGVDPSTRPTHSNLGCLKVTHLSALVGDLDFFSVMFKCFNLVMKGLIKWQEKDVLPGFLFSLLCKHTDKRTYVNIRFEMDLNKTKVH